MQSTQAPMMKLILASLFCNLALWAPVRADDPPCIHGFQSFPGSHVIGGEAWPGPNTEEECKEQCVLSDCAGIDFNFATNPFKGVRCWMHSSLDGKKLKGNKNTNHFKACEAQEAVPEITEGSNCPVGPQIEPVAGFTSMAAPQGIPDFLAVTLQGFDTKWPAKNITGFRANIHTGGLSSQVKVYLVGLEMQTNDDGVTNFTTKFGIAEMFNESGIHERFRDGFDAVEGIPEMHPGMILQVIAVADSETEAHGEGLGFTLDGESCTKTYTYGHPTENFGGGFSSDDIDLVADNQCKEMAVQLLFC